MAKIEIYTQPGCPFCQRALMLFQAKDVAVHEINAPKGSKEREEAIERSSGKTTVPQIFIDGKGIGGCDDLMALNQSGELQKLLNI